MFVKMQTESGAVYTIDTVGLTARRVGKVEIVGIPSEYVDAIDNSFKLTSAPNLRIGARTTLWYGPGNRDCITTTKVVRLELVGE